MKNHNELTLNQNLGDTKLVQAWSVMLEPLATSVLTSVISSSRPSFVGHISSASQPALRMVTRQALPHDFFTPHPRPFKGKERALPEQTECLDIDNDSVNGRVGSSSQSVIGE